MNSGRGTRFAFPLSMLALAAALAMPGVVSAQVRTDTTVAPPPPAPRNQPPARATRVASRLAPPLSPRRAFLYSAMLPGFGQSRLDRGTSGALFASIELAALAMVRRSSADLREAKRFAVDSLPSDFDVSGANLTPKDTFRGRYAPELANTRRLHVEDWLAALAFNHLFSGADAFVAAQLWDVPVSLTAIPHPRGGATLVATLRW